MPTREAERFGIVELGPADEVLLVEEKPTQPRSDLAIPGVYFFDGTAPSRAASLQPSPRGETEICDLMESYRADKKLFCRRLGRGFVWLDAGTPQALLEAGNFVATLEKRMGYEVACLEEIAWRANWIGERALAARVNLESNPEKKAYLEGLLE